MPIIRNAEGFIINADELTEADIEDVVHERVLCPACKDKVFEMWPEGWDAHAAGKCNGIEGATARERKANFKAKYRHLFR